MDWDKVFDIFKRHPYAVGGSILALILLIWYFWGSSSSSSSASGIYAYSADPNLIAQQTAEALATDQTNAATAVNTSNNQTAVQLAQIQASTTSNQDASALQALQSNNATQTQIATTQANALTTIYQGLFGVEHYGIQQQTNAALTQSITQSNNSLQAALAAINGTITINNANNQAAYNLQQLNYQEYIPSGLFAQQAFATATAHG